MTDLLSRARGAANPFLLDRVDSAWDEVLPAEISSMNSAALAQCEATIKAVRATHQSRGLLLMGDPGSGKSHLLNRLRRSVLASGRDCFVYARPHASAGTLFVELLRLVVTDIVRRPDDGGPTQLELMVAGALPSADTTRTPMQRWLDICRSCPAGSELFARLKEPFEDLVLGTRIDADVAQVLRHYIAAHHRLDAFRWLTATSVPEDVLNRLGVGKTLEEGDDARRALIAISSLAGAHCVLVLAFDQLEAMQLRPHDLDGVYELGNVLSDLLVHCRNIAAIGCVQSYFYEDLKKALPQAYMDRIGQDVGGLHLLRRAEALALVDARLASVPELAAARAELHAPPLWPLDAEQLMAALGTQIDQGGLTARVILNAARQLFDAWQGSSPPPPEDDDLDAQFQNRQEAALNESPDENIMADGLLKVLDTIHPKHVRRSRIPGIQIELTRPGEIQGISVCHAQNMTSLAARLKKVVTAHDKDIARAIVVRDERLPISRTAAVTQKCLRELQEKGSPLVRSSSATYAAIAAARQLLAQAMTGDLYVRGHAVGPDAVRQWLLQDTPKDIKDLLAQIEGAEDEAGDDVLERLRATLDGVWVRPLPDACAASGVDEELAMARLLSGQGMVGLITGRPSVIFLRPAGLPRT